MTSILHLFVKIFKQVNLLVLLIFSSSMFALEKPVFEINSNSTCAPCIVNLSNKSALDQGISYSWQLGSDQKFFESNQSKIESSFTQPGKYQISLRAVKGSDTSMSQQIITVHKAPEASFAAEKSDGCIPFAVNLKSTSTLGDTSFASYSWDLRNGVLMTGEQITFSYSNEGMYDVLLKVTDNNGCSATSEIKNYIKVHRLPRLNFSASDSFSCNAPLKVSFTNTSLADPATVYNWDFGNGLKFQGFGASATYEKNGSFDVMLKGTDPFGCSDSLMKKNYINIGKKQAQILVSGASKNKDTSLVCPGVITLSTSTFHTSYAWQLFKGNQLLSQSDKPAFNVSLLDSGKYQLVLNYDQNTECPDIARKEFTIDYLQADFDIKNTTTCPFPAELEFTSHTKNVTKFSWLLPDTNINDVAVLAYKFNKKLSYNQTYSHEVNSNDLPVLLQVTNKNNCLLTVTKNYHAEFPVARMVPDKVSGCIPLKISFSDSSKSKTPIKQWDYVINGVKTTKTDTSALAFTFNKSGTYKSFLIIKTADGCIDTSYSIQIQAGESVNPDVTIEKNTYCYADTLKLQASSSLSDSVDYWNFECSKVFQTGFSKSSTASIQVKPDSAGFYDITVSADFNGCISSVTKTKAFQMVGPFGLLNDSFSCLQPLDYLFVANIKPYSTLSWQIDSLLPTTNDSVNIHFPNSGDYKVVVKAHDATTHCTLKREKTIAVRQIKAAFTHEPIVCIGNPVKLFSNDSRDYINTCYNEGFLWSFGDYLPDRRTWSIKHEHNYTSRGDFKIQLVALADNGCTDTAFSSVKIVGPKPSFTLMPSSGCAPSLNVAFTDNSNDSTIIGKMWYFGDGSSDGINDNPQHSYYSTSTNTFYPYLWAVDQYGCYTTYGQMVKIIKPNIDFQADQANTCINIPVNFSLSTLGITNQVWEFGDNESGASPSHSYKNAGNYTVKISGKIDDCPVSASKELYINVEEANAEFSMSKNEIFCYPEALQFTHLHQNGIVDGNWIFDSKNSSNGYVSNPTFTYNESGEYHPSLFVRTSNNCTSTASQTLKVTGPKAKLEFSEKKICQGETVHFNVTNQDNVKTIKLGFGDGDTSNLASVDHHFSFDIPKGGVLKPYLQLNNCPQLIQNDSIMVSPLKAEFNMASNPPYCSYKGLSAINNSFGQTQNTWFLGTKQISTDQNLQYTSTDTENSTLKLLVFDGKCYDSASKALEIIESPIFDISGKNSICFEKESAELSIAGKDNWTIRWYPVTGVSNPAIFNPIINPQKKGHFIYTARVNHRGCFNEREIEIISSAGPEILNRTPAGDTTVDIGAQIPLLVIVDSTKYYRWSPASDLSCTECNQTISSTLNDKSYFLTLENECGLKIDTFNIHVLVNYYIEAPNAFTPNGDKNNDIFKLETKNISEFNLKIFNRWGNLVFESNDPQIGWDGTYNGKKQAIDTYAYFVSARTNTGYKVEKKGNLMLLK